MSDHQTTDEYIDALEDTVDALRILLDIRPGPGAPIRLWEGWSARVSRELRKLDRVAVSSS